MRDDLVPMLDAHMAEFDHEFEWGKRDCVTFAASWVEKVTGKNPIPVDLTWHDLESATAAISKAGGGDLRELASKAMEERPVLTARMGDIVGRQWPTTGWALGICEGSSVRFLTLYGQSHISLTRCEAAWGVECRQS